MDMRTPASSGSESLSVGPSGARTSILDLNGNMAELYFLLDAVLAVGAGAIAGAVRRAVRAIHMRQHYLNSDQPFVDRSKSKLPPLV